MNIQYRRKQLIATVFLTMAISLGSITNIQAKERYKYLYADLPFDMPLIERPQFPANQINLKDCGGVSDGIYLNTEAFEKAFSTLAAKGGGTLIVPTGIWLTGPIVFRSNINLHLEKGALILFSPDFNLYPLVNTVYEGLDTRRCQSPISGRNLENIAITGYGSINGSGDAWRPLKNGRISKSHWESVIKSGGVLKDSNFWFPTESSLRGEIANANTPKKSFTDADWLSFKDYLRPVMVSFIECKNVLLEGVLFENSPAWNIHPLMCENVIIDNIYVRNPFYAQNGDGIDLESCVNSIITNCTFDVGDDAICIKSGKDEDGRRRARPTENVIVENCKVFHGHGGFVVGSEMSAGVRNISVKNCQFMGTNVGLRFKAGRGRGGVVENIYIENINMFNIPTEAFLFDLYYGSPKTVKIPLVDETTPVFRNIYVKNLIARNVNRAMFFNGLPEMNIDNIHVEDVIITANKGAELVESKNIEFKNVKIIPKKGPALILDNVENMKVVDLKYPDKMREIVHVSGEKTKNINLPKTIKEDRIIKK